MPHKEKGVYTEEYSKMYDRSRYQYMLDAPFEVSNMCCKVMKKAPIHKYNKETGRVPITAQMAEESKLRTSSWLRNGCNAFEAKNPISNPMSFWTEQDVLKYIQQYLEKPLKRAWKRIYHPIKRERKKARKYLRRNNYRRTAICSVVEDYSRTDIIPGQTTLPGYEDEIPLKTTGCTRTGCMICGFGCHLEKSPNRFEMLKESHPGMYTLLDKVKNNGYTMREAIEWISEHGKMNIRL